MGNTDFGRVTTVIFDMDGTLIEHTWQLSHICNVLFSRFANELAPVTQEEFYDRFWGKTEDMWYMMVDGVFDGDTASKYAYVNTLRSLGANVELAQPMLNAWIELVLEEALPFDDTYDVLKAVRREYNTGILTNGYINLQRKKIDKYNFGDCVNFTLVSEEVGYHKPDRRVFEQVLKLAGGVLPEETIYVGDNPVADIEGALGAHITPIFMNARDDMEPLDGVIKITRLSALLPLLGLM